LTSFGNSNRFGQFGQPKEFAMQPVVMVIGAGAMGSAVGRRLAERGATVLCALAGRSAASVERARAAGMRAAADDEASAADFVLSIIPPGEAVATAERFAPVLAHAEKKPVFVDCNAVNPQTMARVAAVLAPTGASLVDAGIIGGPPKEGYKGPTFYASGRRAREFAALAQFGLKIHLLDGPVGAASAVKMSYAGITKGLQALGAAMMLAASRAGTASDLRAELEQSQPALLAWFDRQIPQMYSKAYRWVAEMDEIAAFVDADPAAHSLFHGTARLYERLAEDFAGDQAEIAALEAFLGRPKDSVKAAEQARPARHDERAW
jgi:3-hydroxyisobutyrate dehydrogenase-like beta-hydroxyacid dehydrogenase